MTRKNYAAMMCAKEQMKAMQELAEKALKKPTTAYATIKQIQEITAKWNADFSNCDAAWRPVAAVPAQQPNVLASALGAFVQG